MTMKTKQLEHMGARVEIRYSDDAGTPVLVVFRKGNLIRPVLTGELRSLPDDQVRTELQELANVVAHMAATYRGDSESVH